MRHSVKVLLWGSELGVYTSDNKRMSFFYFSTDLPERLKTSFSMLFPDEVLDGRMPVYGDERYPYNGVPPFISDSLPDSWGNELFEQWRTSKRISKQEISVCDKLAFIGVRGMGALEFIPAENLRLTNDYVDLAEIASLAERIRHEREDAVISPDEELTMKALIAVGSSVGGRQAKVLIPINRENGMIKSGQIAGLDGFDYHIVKFDIPERDTAVTEYVYYRLARACGIDMMPSRLLEVEQKKHFLTQRFDRDKAGRKLYVQTLAAMLPGAASYEDLFAVCRKLKLPYEVLEQMFIRMVFNILANNTDDHNKNFSFIMTPEGAWSVAPAYDMTFIYDSGGWRGNDVHCLSVGGRLKKISKEDVSALAAELGIKDSEVLIDRVAGVLKDFRKIAAEESLRPEWVARMADTVDNNLERWGYLPTVGYLDFATADGRRISDVRLELAYRSGNFHLLADIDGKPAKFIIGRKYPEYDTLLKDGIRNAAPEMLKSMVLRYLIGRVD